ncbi:Uu.00g085060.m01.CDS01 [Anthostomella pinea]|uniref:Uu.00g085060.m01.CDS01 n=1 Tax=Anthostomella pinea TaxID=933095 RepID=A0AAI8YJR7_9PEZI|nr:Uu.00g085060.m01.CDS01 [Anthostomella pinea]
MDSVQLNEIGARLASAFHDLDNIETDIDFPGSGTDESHISSTGSSFHEVNYRLRTLTESLDTLYSIATDIRNPRNRPSRTTDHLYSIVPGNARSAYVSEREEVEVNIVAYIQRQDIQTSIATEDTDAFCSHYASPTNWLVRRTGIANARRKQQFVYWKNHAIRLSAAVSKPGHVKPVDPKRGQVAETSVPLTTPNAPGPMVLSLAASAIKLSAGNLLKPDDLKSVISHYSRVSTTVDLSGKRLCWPTPPQPIMHSTCKWTPGDCTSFMTCSRTTAPTNTVRTLIGLWHCQDVESEFETQPDFVQHLKSVHPEKPPEQLSDELLGAAVGPSNLPHRDCPFCPIAFPDITEMQKHVLFHLERLALLAMPVAQGDVDDGDISVHSADNHNAQMRGRQASVLEDFYFLKMEIETPYQVYRNGYSTNKTFYDSLSIGRWTYNPGRTYDRTCMVYYSILDPESAVTYYIGTGCDEYKIVCDFENIMELRLQNNQKEIVLQLNQPTRFYRALDRGGTEFRQCNDFTEDQQATMHLTHILRCRDYDGSSFIEEYTLLEEWICRTRLQRPSDSPLLLGLDVLSIADEASTDQGNLAIQRWLSVLPEDSDDPYLTPSSDDRMTSLPREWWYSFPSHM